MTYQGAFYCIKFNNLSISPDLVCEALEALEWPAGMWQDLETQQTLHTLYYTNANERDAMLSDVTAFVSEMNRQGEQLVALSCFDLPPEDWAESWKKFFDIQHLTPHLVIKPCWLEYESKPNQVVIEIDPGMSFGTGRHATTIYCLQSLERLKKQVDLNGGLLDAGTGSGILAIAAYKMGYRHIDAFDYDEICIPCSYDNAKMNGILPDAIHFYQADLTNYKVEKQYQIVIANILAPVLLSEHARLISMVKTHGYLILAGILSTEYPKIRDAFTAAGLREIHSDSLAEWRSGTFAN